MSGLAAKNFSGAAGRSGASLAAGRETAILRLRK